MEQVVQTGLGGRVARVPAQHFLELRGGFGGLADPTQGGAQ
jgi:hypothetical protein